MPFGGLLETKCNAFIARFVARDALMMASTGPVSQDDLDFRSLTSLNKTIELFIPPPPMATKQHALQYHLATRNFFAWIFRRSLVGEQLGSALIALWHTIAQHRGLEEDNMGDLLGYMDEEGYLDMRNEPNHALGVLHFAEHFQLKDLYVNAFTHCVGMAGRSFVIPEYQASCLLIRLGSSSPLLTVYAGSHLCNTQAPEAGQGRNGSKARTCWCEAPKSPRGRTF